MKRAVFLDRDGVLNRPLVRDGVPYPPHELEEFTIFPEVPSALAALHGAGLLLVVVTNQPDVARGTLRREVVEAMHHRLREDLPIDDIRACFEVDSPESTCYKPKPGMLLSAAADLAIDLPASFMIGDRWRDVGAGHAVGSFTIFIDRGYRESLRDAPDAVCRNLAEAAALVLDRVGRGTPRETTSR